MHIALLGGVFGNTGKTNLELPRDCFCFGTHIPPSESLNFMLYFFFKKSKFMLECSRKPFRAWGAKTLPILKWLRGTISFSPNFFLRFPHPGKNRTSVFGTKEPSVHVDASNMNCSSNCELSCGTPVLVLTFPTLSVCTLCCSLGMLFDPKIQRRNARSACKHLTTSVELTTQVGSISASYLIVSFPWRVFDRYTFACPKMCFLSAME